MMPTEITLIRPIQKFIKAKVQLTLSFIDIYES